MRAILAEEIAGLDCVPKEVALKLANDAEATVSVPILEYSPLLSDNDLLEIIATARARSALAALARRRGVSEVVSDAIVASLDIPAVAALLANPKARVREEALEKVIDHAESIEQWHGPLAMRTDLSLRALRRIAGFVGAALIEQLCDRHGLDDETQAHLNRCLRQRLEREDEKSRNAVDGLRGEIFASRSAKAITALSWRAGLSMRIAFKVQSLIGKLHADELLAARAGVAYPLTEAEMQWHLSYFGLGKSGA